MVRTGQDKPQRPTTAAPSRRVNEMEKPMGTTRWVRLAAAAFLGRRPCSGPAAAASPGHGQEHLGEWQMRCETPAGAGRAMRSRAERRGRGPPQRHPRDYRVEDRRRQEPPPARRRAAGYPLPSGLGLKIDQTDIGRAGFVRCLATGCVAEVVMEDSLISQMKAGQAATPSSCSRRPRRGSAFRCP